MKTKIKRHGRSVISVILAISMLVSCMMVGIIATDAAYDNSDSVGVTNVTIYFTPNSSWDSDSYVANYQWQHVGGDKWDSANFTLESRTIGGNAVYKATFSLQWDGLQTLQLQHYKNNGFVGQYVPVNNSWTGASTFNGKYWDGDSWENPNWDPEDYYIHYGTSDYQSDDWSNDGYLIDGETGYTFALGADEVRSFGINTSSSNKDNTISFSDSTFSYSPTSSFHYAQHVENLNGRNGVKFKSKIAGNYIVKFDGTNVTITGPDGGSTGTSNWYLRNGTYGWDSNGAGSEFIYNSTTGYYEKEVTFGNGDNYFRVSKVNIQYTGSSGSNADTTLTLDQWNNGMVNTSAKAYKFNCTGGTYIIQIDEANSKVRVVSGAKSTLSVENIADAKVVAYYDGNNIEEGGYLDDIPAGATITVNVTPDLIGKKPTVLTTSPQVSPTLSGRTFTFAMPAENTSVTGVTLGDVTTKKVYFNNYYTRYSMVHAYAWYGTADQSTIDGEPLGAWTGRTMTRIANTNTWEIDVPEDCPYIIFVGDNGYNTKNADTTHITIPWDNSEYNPPMYTAGKDAKNPSTNGTWGKYVPRSNETTVSDGDTMSGNENLFTGLTATMYDYYVDSEYTNRGGWLDISDPEYSKSKSGFTNNPYRNLNDALDAYARDNNVTYPLYFGDFYSAKDDGDSDITKVQNGTYNGQIYKNWNKLINNSRDLSDDDKKNAVTGLTGKTLSGSNIHYYNAQGTNENGAEMALFDEDFLSGQNIHQKALAQILRCSSFPVRKLNQDTYTQVYFDASGIKSFYEKDGCSIYAYFWNESVNTRISGTKTGDIFAFAIPEGYEKGKVLFYRSDSLNGTWFNQTGDLDVPNSGNSNVKFTSNGNNNKTINGSWGTYDQAAKNSHVYYEYDSTGGTDNAFITDISSDKKTAKINYYSQSDNKIVYAADAKKAGNGKAGFFPFDYNSYINQTGNTAHDLGFGMKIEIPFTLEKNGQFADGTHQVFDFSGDDDLWVFVDGKLVLDLGGDHNATQGQIDFADKKATATSSQVIAGTRNGTFEFDNSNPNTVHTMTLYYMERGMWDSNLKFGFSFHAIPNQLKTEKKVRTANINAGFYKLNDTTKSGVYVDNGEREVTKFEATYQNEDFIITHEFHKSGDSDFVTASGKKYTIGSSATQTVGADGKYALKNDEIAYFLGQFDKGDTIRLKESADSTNLYNYDMSVAAYDDANNGAVVTGSGNAADGYSFEFRPTSTATTTIDNLNLRARFTNQMKSHNLTLTKNVVGESDNTSFKFRIKFKFGDYDYTAYPLNCYVETPGTSTKLNTALTDTGEITITNGQTITLEKIPENALVQIEEVDVAAAYNFNGVNVTGAANVTTVNNGVQFKVDTADVSAVVTNSKFTGFTVSKELKYSQKDGEEFVDYPDSDSQFIIKVEQSDNGTSWSPLANTAFTSSDTSRTVNLQTDANGVTTIKRGEKISFSEIQSNKYIRVTEDTQTSYNYNETTQQIDVTNHMPLDYQYRGTVAVQGASNPTEYHNDVVVDDYFKGCSFQLTTGRVDVTITNMKPRYEYIANYLFASRKKNVTKSSNESYLGDLSYKANGVFTAEELYKYTQFAMKKDYQQQWQKGIDFKDTASKEEFFTKKTAPFDDNFRQGVTWKIAEANVEYHFGDKNTACQLVITPSPDYSAAPELNVNFYLPCAMKTNSTKDELVVDESKLENGVPKAKFDANGRAISNADGYYTLLQKNGVYFADWYTTNGRNLRTNSQDPKFVTAPLVVYDVDANANKYFQYWSIKTMENDSKNSVEYAKCYSNQMNYVFFKDSEVYAVYGDKQATGYENARTLEGNSANLVFLENSRNQWNQRTDGVAAVYKNGANYGDRIFSDFVLDFHYVTKDNENLLLQTIPEADRNKYKAGLLIETVRELDSTEVDKTNKKMLKTDKQIADSFRSIDNMNAQNDALDALTALYKNNTTLNSKYLNSQINVSKFDNKNELEYAYSFANISQTKDYRNETTRKDQLYRAYAYLIHVGGGEADDQGKATDVKIISAPVYFTIYDMASIVNDYDVEVTKK